MIYIFKHDGQCAWMKHDMHKNWPSYLSKPVTYDSIPQYLKKDMAPYQGEKQFYVISDWLTHIKTDSIPKGHMLLAKEHDINLVKSLDDLPEDGGIYVTGYDSAADEINLALQRGISVINNPCPWISRLKKQILSVNSETHQCVIMMDQQHILYRLYRTICPKDTIYILPENYTQEISANRNGKPIHLLCYVTFRTSEIERAISFINNSFPHPENNFYDYKTALCCWTRQGIYEELHECIYEKKINQFWLIYTNENDRSLRSLINELNEHNVSYLKIRDTKDIPTAVNTTDRIGVVITPVPMVPSVLTSIVTSIKSTFPAMIN